MASVDVDIYAVHFISLSQHFANYLHCFLLAFKYWYYVHFFVNLLLLFTTLSLLLYVTCAHNVHLQILL